MKGWLLLIKYLLVINKSNHQHLEDEKLSQNGLKTSINSYSSGIMFEQMMAFIGFCTASHSCYPNKYYHH